MTLLIWLPVIIGSLPQSNASPTAQESAQPTIYGAWRTEVRLPPNTRFTLIVWAQKDDAVLQLFTMNYPKDLRPVPLSDFTLDARRLTANLANLPNGRIEAKRVSGKKQLEGILSSDRFDRIALTWTSLDVKELKTWLTPRPSLSKAGIDLIKPDRKEDQLEVGSWVEAGLRKKVLQTYLDQVLSKKLPNLHSLLVAVDGRLVVEEYFYGFGPDDLHETRSAFKSLIAMMVMIAHERGLIPDLKEPILTYLPQYKDLQHLDGRKQRITIADLLTMRAGLDNGDYGSEDQLQNQHDQPDWVRYMLDAPMVHEPGTVYDYSSGAMNLLVAVLEKATGRKADEFLIEEIFKPLGIDRYRLNYAPDGRLYGAGGALQRPRDLIKLGLLVLDGGSWKGKTVMSAESITRMMQPEVHNIQSSDHSTDYGYLWYIHSFSIFGRNIRTWQMRGNGGQFLVVAPELHMVIAVNAGNYNRGQLMDKTLNRLGYGVLASHPKLADLPAAFLADRIKSIGVAKAMTELEGSSDAKMTALRGQWQSLLAIDAYFKETGLRDLGSDLLAWSARHFPDQGEVHLAWGKSLADRQQFKAARKAFGEAVARLPKDCSEAKEARWLHRWALAISEPKPLDTKHLQKMAGTYGPRQVVVRDGVLTYMRSGTDSFHFKRLFPIDAHQYVMIAYPNFILKFERDDDGAYRRLSGHYLDGTSDQTQRNP